MNTINDISEELKNMGTPLADMSRKMPYKVPSGFFESFDNSLQDILNSLKENDHQADWGKTLPYAIPNNYFEELTADVINKVAAEFPRNLAKETPFHAPAGYFESLPEKMLEAVKADEAGKKTKQIPLKPNYPFVPVRWAAAVVIFVCISMGAYMTFFANNHTNSSDKILASIPDSELQDYFQHTYRMDADMIVSNNEISNMPLENKDIIQYLNETGWDATE